MEIKSQLCAALCTRKDFTNVVTSCGGILVEFHKFSFPIPFNIHCTELHTKNPEFLVKSKFCVLECAKFSLLMKECIKDAASVGSVWLIYC